MISRKANTGWIGTSGLSTAAPVPATMPAKNPQPLKRHQCHFSTFGATYAGTSAETIHSVTE